MAAVLRTRVEETMAGAILGQAIAPSRVAGGLIVVATVMWLGSRRR